MTSWQLIATLLYLAIALLLLSAFVWISVSPLTLEVPASSDPTALSALHRLRIRRDTRLS